MAMASTPKLILGSMAFAIFWVLAVFPAVPFLPIGRTAGALLGAILMVIFQVLTSDQAYAAIDLAVLGLLFGTMVVSVFLERADMFKYLGKLLSWKRQGRKDLLCRICLISAVSSAFFTNDTSCVVLTEFVLKMTRQQNLPPHPFLLALASSANIGSAATPIGNPQNLIIAVQSRIGFMEFLTGVAPAMVVGVFVNIAFILAMYWNALGETKDVENNVATPMEVMRDDDIVSHRFAPATMSHLDGAINPLDELSPNSESGELENSHVESMVVSMQSPSHVKELKEGKDSAEETNLGFSQKWKKVLWKICVYVVTLGMLIALLVGLNMSWTAVAAALALLALDFKDARPCLEKVSYSLLVFFCGMFITVEGFNRTGIPSTFWDFMEPHAKIDHITGTLLLAIVVILLSNLASNVPTVLLLGARVAASAATISPASEKKAWLLLAWVSTVAGNLSLLGSAANLIVCEQARRSKEYGYTLTFWTHLKFGVPSTIIVTAIGLALIRV